MIIKELFEGPVGDYCIARNTIKCLLIIHLTFKAIGSGQRSKGCHGKIVFCTDTNISIVLIHAN